MTLSLRSVLWIFTVSFTMAGCDHASPPDSYDAFTRKKRYEAAHNYISDREIAKHQKSEVRFFDTAQGELDGALLPYFNGDKYAGAKTKPIGWTVRVFDRITPPFPPKTYSGQTVVFFDLDGKVNDAVDAD
ncbi:hypothetical protein N9908_05290 [Akkermansiaceae bacterium]|nr:hypothetical protein [Akkermansiaceae bacterium]